MSVIDHVMVRFSCFHWRCCSVPWSIYSFHSNSICNVMDIHIHESYEGIHSYGKVKRL